MKTMRAMKNALARGLAPARRLGKTLAMLALATATALAAAHDTWLATEQRGVDAGGELSLLMTSGERFPILGTVIAPSRIERAACRQGASTVAFKPPRREPKALRLSTQPIEAGAITCWVVLAPRSLELKETEVDHYLDEIDAPVDVRSAWERAARPRRWIETYAKHAKVTVPAAAAGSVGPAEAPVGLKLELVVGKDLSEGRIDTDLPVLVLLDGKPRAGLSVALTGEGPGAPQRQRTNAQGEAIFAAPTSGRWMLSATDLGPAPSRPGEWESQFTTLVFEILPGAR